MSNRASLLEEIVVRKREEVARAKERTSQDELEMLVAQEEPPRNFFAAVTRGRPGGTAVIAEIKRKGPSAGYFRPEYERPGLSPERLAQEYHEHGAAAIACATDVATAEGRGEDIRRVKDAVPLPVLRLDFLVDAWQVWESRALGADAIQLIGECLTEGEVLDLTILGQRLGMTVLLEVHEVENLLRLSRHVGFPHRAYGLLAINNRNRNSGVLDPQRTLRLADMVEDRSVLVSESGIASPEDLARLRSAGVRIALVGEHLLRRADPGRALGELLGPAGAAFEGGEG